MNNIHDLSFDSLRVLSSVFETRSTTLSAQRLGVTQSAISHSLKKLREVLGDELVFRQGNGLELTAKGEALKVPLEKWLNEIVGILRAEEFNPAESEKVFTIATTDIVEHLLVPRVIKQLQKMAPKVQLRFIRWEYKRIAPGLLNGQIDLAIGVRSFDSPNILQRTLYEESFISMARKKHPIFDGKVTLEKFLSFPHVMTGPGDGRGAIDNYLEKLNRKKRLLYTVNSFSSAPALLENSDCILTAPKKFLEYSQKKHRVELFKTPIKMKAFTIKLFWAKKQHEEKSHKWLRDLFYQCSTN